MKGYNNWNYKPYIPLDRLDNENRPYITRIAPYEDSIEIEYSECEDKKLYINVLYETDTKKIAVESNPQIICNLEPEKEYIIYIEDENGKKSVQRKVKTGFVPGTVVNYLHPKDDVYAFSGHFLCSPSIVRLPSGGLLASNDIFGHSMPQNLTILYRSENNGKTWQYAGELFPCFWGKLFMHNDRLYMLGMSTEYGDVLIGCSEDEGYTWSAPTVILRGSCSTSENGPHRAPCVITKSHGRLWSSLEYGSWANNEFSSGVLSIDENADLMKAENWTCSELLRYDKSWTDAPDTAGAIEGNIVELPNGDLVNCLRLNVANKMLILKIDPNHPEKKEEFVKTAEFPLGHTKFEIQKNSDGYYYAVGNRLIKNNDEQNSCSRNILSIYRSKDTQNWEFLKDVLNYSHLNKNYIGFQYPAFLISGDEMLILSRTAFNGAESFHDNNYITFHKIKL